MMLVPAWLSTCSLCIFSSADKAVILWNLVSSQCVTLVLCLHGDPRVNGVRSEVHCIHLFTVFLAGLTEACRGSAQPQQVRHQAGHYARVQSASINLGLLEQETEKLEK